MAVQVSVAGSYWAPALVEPATSTPPQISMREPVHTAVWPARADGAPVAVVGTHESVASPASLKPASRSVVSPGRPSTAAPVGRPPDPGGPCAPVGPCGPGGPTGPCDP